MSVDFTHDTGHAPDSGLLVNRSAKLKDFRHSISKTMEGPSHEDRLFRATHHFLMCAARVLAFCSRLSDERPSELRCYGCGIKVIKAPIFGVPMPVARSYPGTVGKKPLLFIVWPIPVMSWK